MQVEKDVFVEMRDGVGLAVDVYKPDEFETHAAILVLTPYQKDAVFTVEIPLGSDGRRIEGLIAGSIPEEIVGLNASAFDAKPFVEAGFVVVVADARGTGRSEGIWDYYNFEGGPYDGYDLVEWSATQPWCSGRVGMMGASASGIYCHVTALTQPPHLRAVAADSQPGDFYFDQWRVGGVFRWENRISWAAAQLNNIQPLDPGDPNSNNYERKRAVYEARFHQYGKRAKAGKNPVNIDWLTDLYSRSTYDERWRHWSFVSRLSKISVPVLYGGVWFDHFARGTVTCYDAVRTAKRLVMKPGTLMTRPELGDGGFVEIQIAWFDHFLRDVRNGVLEQPPVRLYLTGQEEYIDEPRWPVPTAETPMFLTAGPSGLIESVNDGSLQWEPSDSSASSSILVHVPDEPNRTVQDVFDQRPFERCCLTFTSAPLDTNLEVIGRPRLILFALTDAPDVDWCVQLCDVDADGRSKLLNIGALKGSHVYSHERPIALETGTIYTFEIEIWPIANLFKAGHRIRLDVSTSDFPLFESNPHASSNRVFHDQSHRSSLVLPVVRR